MHKSIKKINWVILLLTLSDVFVWGMYMIANPLQAIYLKDKFGEESTQLVATGLSIYFLLRASLQIPIGKLVDYLKKDVDEIWALGIGSLLIGISLIIFPFTQNAWQYYTVTALAGIGASSNLIGWRKLFAKNLSKNKEGFEYATYETMMSVCTAIIGITAGQMSLVTHEQFTIFFATVGIIIIIGGISVASTLMRVERRPFE
jgi:MFS family permease